SPTLFRSAVQAPSAPAVQAPASAPVAAPAPVRQAPEAVVRPTVRLAPVAARPRRAPVRVPSVVHAQRVAPDPEVTAPGTASVVWLNRQLPDPTPPSRRLRRTFVHKLVRASGKEWPLELALLRVQGRAALPVRPLGRRLATLSAQDQDEQATALALVGDSTAADRVVALAHYYRAVGDETLIQGLEASKARLELKLLADPRVTIYPGGRSDLEGGRVNVRVLATIAYLADTFGSVEVSSLVTGHRLYA